MVLRNYFESIINNCVKSSIYRKVSQFTKVNELLEALPAISPLTNFETKEKRCTMLPSTTSMTPRQSCTINDDDETVTTF